VVEQVVVDAAANRDHQVVLAPMLLRHFVQLAIHLLDNHFLVLPSVACVMRFL